MGRNDMGQPWCAPFFFPYMTKHHITLLLTLITATLLAACGFSPKKEKEKLRIEKAALERKDSLAWKMAVTPTIDCLPVFIAADRGIFEQLGLDVSLKEKMAQMDCEEALSRRQVESAVSDLMRTERLRRQGVSIDYVTATNAYWQMLGNRKGRIKDIKNLGDKMVAMARYSATDYLATLAIDSVKPENPVFRIQVNDVEVRLMMLLNNEMDAAMLTEPQATTARNDKHPVLMDSRHKDIRLGVIAYRKDMVADSYRKGQYDKFVEAYNRACDSINERGLAHYADIIMARCHTDKATVKALPQLQFPHATPPRPKDIERTKNVKWRTS